MMDSSGAGTAGTGAREQAATAGIDRGVGEPHPAHLAHHFSTPGQQLSASKLGMWLFLATEVLLFGGLFCAYAIYRTNHPAIFRWGHHFLDVKWGAANTVILLVSSFTVAWGVHCAQRSQRRRLALLLGATLLCGLGFMAIKFVEYRSKWEHGLLWGRHFRPDPKYVAEHFGQPFQEAPQAAVPAADAAPARAADAKRGRERFLNTCATCHGASGEGLPGQAKDLRGSQFISEKSDVELLAFVKTGRPAWDPLNTMKVDMPPRGGNPMLKDDDLRDIVAHVRVIQETYEAAQAAGPAAAQTTTAAANEAPVLVDKWVVPPPPPGPAGLRARGTVPLDEALRAEPPPNAHVFFGIYFLLTGLHGLHVLAGLVVIGGLLVFALLGRFSAAYFTPVELGGLYWHLVDLIWIYLFPLLYLIH